MTVIQHKIRRFATIQSDFGHIWEQEAASSSLATPIKGKTAKSCRNICAFCGFFVLYFCLKADWNAHKKCDILISQTNQNQEVSRHAQTQRKQE